MHDNKRSHIFYIVYNIELQLCPHYLDGVLLRGIEFQTNEEENCTCVAGWHYRYKFNMKLRHLKKQWFLLQYLLARYISILIFYSLFFLSLFSILLFSLSNFYSFSIHSLCFSPTYFLSLNFLIICFYGGH
jgi:hypothetical protein